MKRLILLSVAVILVVFSLIHNAIEIHDATQSSPKILFGSEASPLLINITKRTTPSVEEPYTITTRHDNDGIIRASKFSSHMNPKDPCSLSTKATKYCTKQDKTPSKPNDRRKKDRFADGTKKKRFHNARKKLGDKVLSFVGKKKRIGNKVLSIARKDRSGSAIQDMLLAHAWAFQHNKTYAGACFEKYKHYTEKDFIEPRMKLLKSVGLDHVLPISSAACKETPGDVVDYETYRTPDAALFTPDFLEFLRSQVQYQPPPENFSQQHRIVVYIRRGDVTPCNNQVRYIPNQQYLDLIDQYNDQNQSQVIVYSVKRSYESLGIFRERGYKVVLNGDVTQVWKDLMTANVTILSKSSFSLIPAILAQPTTTVVYTPFYADPLDHWHVVDPQILNQSVVELARLQTQAECTHLIRDTPYTAIKWLRGESYKRWSII